MRQYVDTLCKDLGIESYRKNNPISELFSPYKPEDFDGFVDEYLANQQAQKEDNSSLSKIGVV